MDSTYFSVKFHVRIPVLHSKTATGPGGAPLLPIGALCQYSFADPEMLSLMLWGPYWGGVSLGVK